MLSEFIAKHREVIIARTRKKVASRTALHSTDVEIMHGVPLFLDQLAVRLRAGTGPGADQLGASASMLLVSKDLP